MRLMRWLRRRKRGSEVLEQILTVGLVSLTAVTTVSTVSSSMGSVPTLSASTNFTTSDGGSSLSAYNTAAPGQLYSSSLYGVSLSPQSLPSPLEYEQVNSLSFQLLDNGAPMKNVSVNLTVSAGTLSSDAVTTDTNGDFTVSFEATATGSVTLTANTDYGSATYSLLVVAEPVIKSVTWDKTVFPPTVTINGEGFGDNAGTVQLTDQTTGWSTSTAATGTGNPFSPQVLYWSENQIVLTWPDPNSLPVSSTPVNYGAGDGSLWSDGLGSWSFFQNDQTTITITNPDGVLQGAAANNGVGHFASSVPVSSSPNERALSLLNVDGTTETSPTTPIVVSGTGPFLLKGVVNWNATGLQNQAILLSAQGATTSDTEFSDPSAPKTLLPSVLGAPKPYVMTTSGVGGLYEIDWTPPTSSGTYTITAQLGANGPSVSVTVEVISYWPLQWYGGAPFVGTDKGVVTLSGANWANVGPSGGLPNVNGLHVDNAGIEASNPSGLYVLNNGSWTALPTNGLPTPVSILSSAWGNNTPWALTSQGVNTMYASQWYPVGSALPSGATPVSLMVNDNTPFVATSKGVYTLFGDTWYPVGNALPNADALWFDAGNNLYAAASKNGTHAGTADILSGSTWSPIGDTDVSDGDTTQAQVTADTNILHTPIGGANDNGTPTVIDANGNTTSLKVLNGSIWTTMGNSLP